MMTSHKNADRNGAVHFAIETVTLDMSLFHGYRIVLGYLDCVWNVMAHAQKPYFVFRRNGRVNLNRRGRQFSRLMAAEVCASAVVMLDTPCPEAVWRVLATHSIRQFPLYFPSRASPCATTFQLDSTFSHPAVLCGQLITNPRYNVIQPPLRQTRQYPCTGYPDISIVADSSFIIATFRGFCSSLDPSIVKFPGFETLCR
jgi:hypothetical protein